MENAESLFSHAEHMPEMPGHNSLLPTKALRSMRRRHLAAEKAMADNPDDEAAQIDAFAAVNGYAKGQGRAVDIISSYVNGTTDVQEAVRQIAEPIDHAYTTADGGRLFVKQERCARSQRGYHEPEGALEMWGPEEDLDELQARVTDPEGAPTVEDELWDLYYTILHVARKTPWRDEGAQQRLVDLIAALKARPDPELPARMTTALKRYWIYEPGGPWSNASLFVPSATDSWNYYPGGGGGWYPCEVNSWTNLNAFVARLTAQHIHDFVRYSLWALRSALDDEIIIHPKSRTPAPSIAVKAESLFEVARVWIRLAGKSVFEEASKDAGQDEETKWARWQRRFEEEAAVDQYSPTVTAAARECAEIMAGISGQTHTS